MKEQIQKWNWLILLVLLSCFHFDNAILQAQIEAELERQFICKGDCIDWEPIITQGAPPYSYSWSTGDEEMIISLCPEGTENYKLTITDANQDSLVISELILVAPVDRSPIPQVTTPICLGETVYFTHPNWGNSPEYHWKGPGGVTFNTKDPIIENVTEADAGVYYLYLEYYDKCITDSISVVLEVEDIDSRSSCEELSQCNFACNVFEIFDLRGRTTDQISEGIQPENFCSNDGAEVTNIQWFGFVAQEGEHVIKFRAINCDGDDEGLRFGIYDDCGFSNLLQCTETCSKENFEISSSILIPGNSYYAYAEGCGINVCDYVVSVEGTMQSIYCNDYVSFDTSTDWKVNVGSFGGSSTFWYNYLRDTTINNAVYRMIGRDGEFSGNGLLLREDKQERIVYSYHSQSNSDKILYDFSLEVGDEYNVEFFNDPFIVTDITLVPSNIGPLKKWNFTSQIGGHSMSYTEAIGGNYLPFPAEVLISDPVYFTSAIFSNCTAIIANDENEINSYRSVIDTTNVTLCEGDVFMGYTEPVILYDTISQDQGCFHINIIDLKFNAIGGEELPYNGVDDDCNPQTPDDDLDGDGFLLIDDCNDSNPSINPGQMEVPYNGIDDDCNPLTLDDDIDQDGFNIMDDCDDNNSSVNPTEMEVAYNGLDDDCDVNTLDDDLDQDGFLLLDDCDDNNPSINPNADEIPGNGIDEDCDGEDILTSTHEIMESTIKLYPNPASDLINIEVYGTLKYELFIYNSKGHLIQKESNKERINLEDFLSGVYLIEIRDQETGKRIIEKIIVNQ